MLRDCALSSPAFGALLDVWRHRGRAAAEFRRSGGKTVGCLGGDVPEEYILAGGMLPVRIPPDPESGLGEADKYLEACFDPMVRSQFDRIVRGEAAGLCDFLAVSNSTDVLVRLYLYLRELRRSEPEVPVPPVAFVDWLFTPSRKFQLANEKTAARFRETAEAWAGRPITDGDVADALRLLNGERAALRRISALRLSPEPRISGTEALIVTGAGFYMDRGEHARLVLALAEEAAAWPVLTGPRVFLSGTEQYDTTVYELLEGAGAVVAAEDHDCGMRWFEGDTDPALPPEKAVAARYMLRSPSPKKAGVFRRVEALCASARGAGARGVAVCMDMFEEAASWDFPEQRKALAALGIEAREFSRLPYPASKDASLKERMEAFVKELKGGEDRG
ncbi:MAG: 2-hydroxyacyl-CoA dehydratase [Oscillospiraceae bacterium]|nr:2-hydroxyacyl-CoA dehydratase [Oscillospiraceae bacterium]